MIAVIDYGAGNIGSVINALKAIGHNPYVTHKPEEVIKAEAVILPGVGAAGNAMKNLNNLGLSDAIRQVAKEKRPLFAVCIGLQLLFEETEESGCQSCLGILPGIVKRFPSKLKVPHMGWNQVTQKKQHLIYAGIPDNTNFYFVHSYYVIPGNASVISGTTDYGTEFCSAVAIDNLIATQFHPEKSGISGLQLYRNFLNMVQGRDTP